MDYIKRITGYILLVSAMPLQAGPHLVDTGFNINDRVAAIHWGEGVHGGFVVWGYHYLQNYHETIPFDTTYAEGCNIIDGWD